MAKTVETKIEKIEDPPQKPEPPVDPDVQIAKLRFWARLVISLMAFLLFGYLVIKMIDKPEELTQSSKDLINLAFGAFLPIIGMLGKHWFETAHDEPKVPEEPPSNNNNPDNKKEEDGSIVTA